MALKHLLSRSILALAITSGLAGCSNSIPDVIKIGAAQPLTGNKAGQGQDLLNGVSIPAAPISGSFYNYAKRFSSLLADVAGITTLNSTNFIGST